MIEAQLRLLFPDVMRAGMQAERISDINHLSSATGISPVTLGRYLDGEQLPSTANLLLLAKVLLIDLGKLRDALTFPRQDLRATDILVCAALEALPAGPSFAELARVCGLSDDSIGRTCKKLEADGWLTVKRGALDRTSVFLSEKWRKSIDSEQE